MKCKRYKAIFFDWNKTLSNSLFWEQLDNPDHERHAWGKDIGDFIFVKNRHIINDWMRGKIDSDHVVSMINDEYSYSKNHILNDLAESCRNMRFVDDSVPTLIKDLRSNGVKCVIATDNMDTFMKYTKPGLELEKYFDDFLVSSELGKLKFDFEDESIPFFDKYLSQNNLSYHDVVLVDDCADRTGTYEKLGFDILQIFNSDDFVNKLDDLVKHHVQVA